MLVINPKSDSIFEYPYFIDDNDSLLIRFVYRPPVWLAIEPRIENKDIVIPTVFNGFQYLCTSGGISGNTEPVWPIETDATIHDGSGSGTGASNHVIWTAQPYNYFLQDGIDISASEWACSQADLANETFTDDYAEVQFGNITAGTKKLILTNSITFGATNQKLNRSILINVKAQK